LTGNVELVNESVNRKIHTPRIPADAAEVPKTPPTPLLSVRSVNIKTQLLVQQLRQLFIQRPIWTRRALLNNIDREQFGGVFKHAYQYVAYMFKSGPWREALVRLGLDPRLDPEMRIYQTMMFQIDADEETSLLISKGNTMGRGGARIRGTGKQSAYESSELNDKSHIFDGTYVGLDGRVWQVCDVADPLLASILKTTNLRERCHVCYVA
jgi:general transcription factor 3C polypeptide 5 (transcription factor C subunit 1)